MGAFEIFFSFYALILGLAVVEVLSGILKVVRADDRPRIGVLTPLLTIWVLLDLANFWGGAQYDTRDGIVGYPKILLSLLVACVYYVAAGLIYPEKVGGTGDLDDHYDRRKRLVLGGIVAANVIGNLFLPLVGPDRDTYLALIALNPGMFLIFLIVTFFPLILLPIRSRRINAILLLLMITWYVAAGLGLFALLGAPGMPEAA